MRNKVRNAIYSLKKQILDNRVTVEGVFLTLILRAMQLALGLLTTYFIAHNFSVENYGHYNFILTVVGVLSVFGLPGLGQAISQSAARGFRGTYRKSFPLSLMASFLATAIILGFAVYSYFQGQIDMMWAYMVAAILFPAYNGLSQWKSLHLGEEKYRKLFGVGSLNAALNSGFVILVALFFPGNIALLLTAYWIVPSLQNMNQTIMCMKAVSKEEPDEPGSISYGLKNSLYAVLGLIASNVDNILIYTFLSPVHLALFAAAQKIPELIKSNIQEIGKALLPKFSKQKNYTQKTDQFFKLFSIVIGGGIVGVTFTIFPFIFHHLFGDKYADALLYSQILMCSIAIANVAPLKFWFVASRLDTKSSRDINLLISLTRIIMSSLLVPIWGLEGAVASAVLHRVITSVGIHYLLKKRYPLEG